MGKQGGLGQRLYVGGYDISGDIIEVGGAAMPMATLETTGIDKSAKERIYGHRDGLLDVTAWFNPENVTTVQEHAVYSTLPTVDVPTMYTVVPPAIGADVYTIVGKQINYDPKRAADGSFTFGVSTQANQFGAEWGKLLTVGKRTDSAATNGTALDQTTVSTAFGWQAYLQVFAMAGTDVTVKLQDSADNSTFADLTGAAFSPITTTTPGGQRLQAASATATVRRYVRASTTTAGGFTNLVFAVAFVRNLQANAF
jgi:hypothetical protein